MLANSEKQNETITELMIDADAAITLLGKWPEKVLSGFERDSNPQPLRYRCNALPTELSKQHESGRVWVGPLRSVDVILGSSI